jgi:soluble lytic murein transglycosylase
VNVPATPSPTRPPQHAWRTRAQALFAMAFMWSTTSVGFAQTPPALSKVSAPRPAAELEHFKRLDSALAPLKNVDISTDEAGALRETMKAIASQDIFKALELKGGVKDALALKLVNWYRLRGGYGQLAEYKPFLAENPAWPERGLLVQRYEELLFAEGGTAQSIKDQFKDQEPKTGMGWAALASAELASGDPKKATELAAKVWRTMNVPPTLETGFLDALANS